MTREQAKEKARSWLTEIKERYNYKDFEPCDFLLENATVLDMIFLADDVEMLSEMILAHGNESLKPCLCDALKFAIDLENNECYKTIRVADLIDMKKCIEMRKEEMSSLMSGLTADDKEAENEN